MIIFDFLYGKFELPEYIEGLVLSPEVRRLSQIRLLNSVSPTISSLSEVRRYSHTLGVLNLSNQSKLVGFGITERRALAAAILAHDIGTPPFGHLLEYHLIERYGWDHENAIPKILTGTHSDENRAFQVFVGRASELRHKLKKAEIDDELVQDIVSQKHPLSRLVFGSLDFDNLDNVARMAAGLGLGCFALDVISIAREMTVDQCGRLILPIGCRSSIEIWASLRRKVYEILCFDPMTIGGQAVLSHCISSALDTGLLTQDDWVATDEELLRKLAERSPDLKDMIAAEYLGRPPRLVFCIQLSGGIADLNIQGRASGKITIEKALKEVFASPSVLGYVLIDSGTFEKKLEFVSPQGDSWSIGERSASVILYGFTRTPVTREKCRRAAGDVVDAVMARADQILRLRLGTDPE